MLIGSIGGLITNGALAALWLLGDPTTMTSNPATGALNWGYFLILYLVLTIITAGFQGISGNIVIPMTADCADYEVYRTGKYVPGLMGTCSASWISWSPLSHPWSPVSCSACAATPTTIPLWVTPLPRACAAALSSALTA